MVRRPFLNLMYKSTSDGVDEALEYVEKHRRILSSGYSVNTFDSTEWIHNPNGLELDVESISSPPSNLSTRERFSSKDEIMRKLEELVGSLRRSKKENNLSSEKQ
ncbi:hypothetical protein HYV88_00865 [Candidatus Woesearchaeota archaeon]|nr:hypothetical protein [Candidatus Woesearchaeota archaeon]